MIPAPASQQVEYIGRVLDGSTEAPIRGAKVTFDFQGAPPIVYTDSEGIYRFTISIEGDKLAGRVRIEATGYENYDRNITLLLNNPNIEDIRLSPLASSEIVVAAVTSTDTPLPISEPSNTPTPTMAPTLPPETSTPTATPARRVGQEWVNLRSFPAPAARPFAVIRVADNLWVSASGRLYRLNLQGDIVEEMDLPDYYRGNWAWDGESLWVSRDDEVHQCDPTSWKELAVFKVDLDDIRGIAWDGSALWMIDSDGNLARYDHAGQRLRRLAVPVNGWPIEMTWVEGELWVVDVHGKVTRFNNEFIEIGSFSLGQCGGGPFPYSLALYWDGESLWLANSEQNRIFQCVPAD